LAIRNAFEETMKDPAFIADAENRSVDLTPADYTSVDGAVKKAINAPRELFQRFQQAIGGS